MSITISSSAPRPCCQGPSVSGATDLFPENCMPQYLEIPPLLLLFLCFLHPPVNFKTLDRKMPPVDGFPLPSIPYPSSSEEPTHSPLPFPLIPLPQPPCDAASHISLIQILPLWTPKVGFALATPTCKVPRMPSTRSSISCQQGTC